MNVELEFKKELKERGLVKKDPIKEKLEKSGFNLALTKLDSVDRLQLAYQNYKVITESQIKEFNDLLRKKTQIETRSHRIYKRIAREPLSKYDGIPPEHCLDDIIKAKETKIFDSFELIRVEWTNERLPDPIVLGVIDKCSDRFFITQWDTDIKLEDIIGQTEE